MPEYVAGYGNRLAGSGPYLDDVLLNNNNRGEKADLESWPIYLYGNSYSILSAAYFTAGKHYSQLVSQALGGGPVTSYGVLGKRIVDVVGTLINGANLPGCAGAVAAGLWPGVSSRQGLVILESMVNDIGHYPAMNVSPVVPAALPAGNTRYRDSLKAMYRTALALINSGSRVEQTARTATSGVWTHDSAQVYASGSSVSFTSAAGAYVEYTVTPPQKGPFKGKVYLLGYALDPAVGVMAQQQINVDAVLQTTRTPAANEQYTGVTGAQVNITPEVVEVTLPVDNASHVIRLIHNGAGGQFMYADGVIVPSEDPNPILVMGAEHNLVGTPVWTATQTAVYHGNVATIVADIKSVVAEFSNAVYVPSTVTAQGIYSVDGIHLNDKGNAQRAVDAKNAINANLLSRLESRVIAAGSSAQYAIL